MNQQGIRVYLQLVPGSRNSTKLSVFSRHQQIIRLDFEDHFPAFDPKSIAIMFVLAAQQTDVVMLWDFTKCALRDVHGLLTIARRFKL